MKYLLIVLLAALPLLSFAQGYTYTQTWKETWTFRPRESLKVKTGTTYTPDRKTMYKMERVDSSLTYIKTRWDLTDSREATHISAPFIGSGKHQTVIYRRVNYVTK